MSFPKDTPYQRVCLFCLKIINPIDKKDKCLLKKGGNPALKTKVRHTIKHIKLLLTLMLNLCGQNVFSSAEKISFNDERFIFKGPKGAPFYKANDGVEGICFSITGKKIKIGTINVTDSIEKFTAVYNYLDANKHLLARMEIAKSLISMGTENIHTGAYVSSGEEMSLSAGITLILKDTIAISGEGALFTSPLIQTDHFFFSAQKRMTFKAPEDASSWLESLTFVASAGTRPFKLMFMGDLNLRTPATIRFFVVGAQKIIFNLKNV